MLTIPLTLYEIFPYSVHVTQEVNITIPSSKLEGLTKLYLY